ncbi:glycosyltransferase family 4 protein [Algoriphagus sp.]|uniref:glycosyltransferase family 4 protein n=1 Tax=Algoriphagus sp. TaxID=1872435 RepID=UPI002719573F|nr:glycosyltransferase family 4 protein [Algoriphagus sp.]MDO8965705.1 glycosyltransferase family 4 protein [Algoriphagus sp.]MDP3202398.1 glycosyltransferase family 4 protein [Algoriphagus sp.]
MAKIAILYELLGRSRGGIEAYIYHVTEELLKQGHHVTLFNVQDITPFDAAPKGAEIITLKQNKKVPFFNFYSKIFSLRSQLKKNLTGFDLVWARSFTMALAAIKIVGKNNVVYINAAPFSFYGQTTFKEKLRNTKGFISVLRTISWEISIISAYKLERRAILNSKNVFLSKARMEETLSFFKLNKNSSKILIVPPGVNTQRFKPKDTYNSIDNTLNLITVSRLVPDKNIQCVILAVKKLNSFSIPVKLTIVGEGPYDQSLKNLVLELGINRIVEFVGRQENVEEWYQRNDLFILPSLYEGFGSVYIEAMSSGLPCIAISNKSGKYSVAADEIIDQGINGYLMSENDPDELFCYLEKLYRSSELRFEYSKNARLKAETQYCWENTIIQLFKI